MDLVEGCYFWFWLGVYQLQGGKGGILHDRAVPGLAKVPLWSMAAKQEAVWVCDAQEMPYK